jgi:hypothetical protein
VKLTGARVVGILWVGLLFIGVGNLAWDEHTFNAMSAAQHLSEAKQCLRGSDADVDTGLRHLAAIPKQSVEVTEAKEIQAQLSTRKGAIEAQLSARESDLRQAVEAQKQVKEAQKAAVVQLRADLKNLGYNFTVAQSEFPEEVVITSGEFAETDHRVRFLSFLRRKNSPALAGCFAGLRSVRLKSSQYFGFDESYSLNCFE